MNTYWTSMCLRCRHLEVVSKVRTYETYPVKDREHAATPGSAVLVRGTLACAHACAFITSWRQFQPHMQPIGATR